MSCKNRQDSNVTYEVFCSVSTNEDRPWLTHCAIGDNEELRTQSLVRGAHERSRGGDCIFGNGKINPKPGLSILQSQQFLGGFSVDPVLSMEIV